MREIVIPGVPGLGHIREVREATARHLESKQRAFEQKKNALIHLEVSHRREAIRPNMREAVTRGKVNW